MTINRATDADADGCGRLYVSSWKDGGFDFSKPDVGFVVRVTPKGHRPEAFPDLAKAPDADLVGHLTSASGVRRTYAQREILRRGAGRGFEPKLSAAAAANGPLAGRVAAICTLNLLAGSKAADTLVSLTKDDAVREYALRTLADAPEGRATAPVQPFQAALADPNPRVRLQAAVGLGRLGRGDTAASLIPLTADADPVVTHVAVNALVALRAVVPCLAALESADAKAAAGALRVLQSLHLPLAVDGLIRRLKSAPSPDLRRGVLVALARLYNQEAAWEGKWWGTRPDTTGPYYNPVAWGLSEKIAVVLKDAISTADSDTLRWLLPELIRHRVELPEVTKALVSQSEKDAGLRRVVVQTTATRASLPGELVPLLARVATTADEPAGLRATAVRVLAKQNAPAARDAVIVALTSADKLPGELDAAWLEFVRDGKRNGEVASFTPMAADPSPAKRALAVAVLAAVADAKGGNAKNRAAAQLAVDAAWNKPETAAALTRAIARLGLSSFAPQLRKLATGPDATLAAVAKDAMKALRIDPNAAARKLIANLKYEAVLAESLKDKGDADLGGKLFGRAGCANCHTVSTSEPLKGPLLAGITTRYNRAELVESIVKPSAKIAQGFDPFTFVTVDGKSLSGFVVRESGTEVEVRDATGATAVLKKDDIEERRHEKLSIMPEKLVDDLTTQELASILAYLESLKGK